MNIRNSILRPPSRYLIRSKGIALDRGIEYLRVRAQSLGVS